MNRYAAPVPASLRLALIAALVSLAACQRATVADPPRAPVAPPPVIVIPRAAPAGSAVTTASTATAAPAPAGDDAMDAPPEGEETTTTCERFADVPIPPADQPRDADLAALAGCDSEALYYGIGRPADFAAARRCAFAERRQKDAPAIGGSAVLLMIYAGGEGVAPSLDLALRFACEAGFAPAEVSGRVDRLARAKRAGRARLAIDFCEDITSGYMMGWCEDLAERKQKIVREARERAATKGMPAAAVARLDRAAAAFFSSRSRSEVDLSGTARGALAIGAEAALAEDQVAMLEKLASPSSSPPGLDPAKTERALQASYDRLMRRRKGPPRYAGAVEAAGIRRTERLWLAYREAWLSLVKEVRPGAGRGPWKAWLTLKRTKMLDDIDCP